jgi:hypothetical protein
MILARSRKVDSQSKASPNHISRHDHKLRGLEVPGPGAYKLPPTHNGKGFSLPKGPREKKSLLTNDIGPGAYKLPSDISSNS